MLSDADTEPRHRFGQNFMIDQNLVRLIAAAGEIVAGDTVIEVGPGTGTLTEELLATPATAVIAVEIDRDLAGLLRKKFEGDDRYRLIEGDALATKHALNADLLQAVRDARGPVKLVANLPYNIASPLVIELLLAGVSTLVFTVQKEVADRLNCTGGEHYGPLSVTAQLLADVSILRTLPPQAFWPSPKIDSALVRMVRRDRLGPTANAFGRFVHQIFSFRRKTIRKAMVMAGLPPESLEVLKFDGQRRPESFVPDDLLRLFEVALRSGELAADGPPINTDEQG